MCTLLLVYLPSLSICTLLRPCRLNRLALHYTEEYGTLENWLPQAYYAAGGDKKKRGH